MKRYCKMVDDCIVLLSHVSKHRDEPQTVNGLAKVCGIPRVTLQHILTDNAELLRSVAEENHYEFVIYQRKNTNQFSTLPVIDVVALHEQC